MLYVSVPQLELAAPSLLPRLIEIKQEIQSPVKLSILDEVEVNMNVQPAPRACDVDAAAEQLLVSKEIWHVCNIGEIGEKL